MEAVFSTAETCWAELESSVAAQMGSDWRQTDRAAPGPVIQYYNTMII